MQKLIEKELLTPLISIKKSDYFVPVKNIWWWNEH